MVLTLSDGCVWMCERSVALAVLCEVMSYVSDCVTQVRGTEKAAGALVRDLRELPSRDALALRAQVFVIPFRTKEC